MINYEQILMMGTDLGGLKRKFWMGQLNEQGEYVYATNAHILIRAKKALFEKKFPPHQEVANFSVIMAAIEIHRPITIGTDILESVLTKIEKIPNVVRCEECDGAGHVKCDYDHKHDCAECNGEGWIEDYTKEFIYPHSGVAIKIRDVLLSPYFLNILREISKLTGDKPILQMGGYGIPPRAQYYHIGLVEVVLMPMVFNDDEEEAPDIYELESGKKITSK